MHRKILAICAALVALGALVGPATASAATAKDTTAGGVVDTLPVGAKIVGYSTGISKLTTSVGSLECNENILTGTIAANPGGAGGSVQGTIEDAWFQSSLAANTHCNGTGLISDGTVTIPGLTNGATKNTHWCVSTTAGTDNWTIVPRNCGAGSGGAFTFVIDAGSLTCYFTRTAAITGTFTTNANHAASVLTMSGEPEFTTEAGTGHSAFCPSSGKLSNMVFDLYTDTTATSGKYNEAANLADPVFITNP